MTAVVGAVPARAPAAARSRGLLVRLLLRWRLLLIFLTLLLLLLAALLWPRILVSVNPGETGVRYRLFGGTDTSRIYPEGLHPMFPWDRLVIYETRHQVLLHSFDVLSVSGLPLHLELAIRFHPDREQLPLLHQRVGPDYPQRVVIPQTESVLRRRLSRYTMEQVYTNEGGLLADAILQARNEVGRNYVIADDILIRTVTLPAPIKAAIEEKLTQEQVMQSYAFRLRTAEEEAERKRAEGRGLRDYQATVETTLTDRVLDHDGIEATRDLATSTNARVVILGRPGDGLPLVSGGGGAAAPP